MVMIPAERQTPEQALQEVADAVAASIKGYVGETLSLELMEQLKLKLMEAVLGVAGFDLKFEPVTDDPKETRYRPANRVTAFTLMALNLGVPLPDPLNLKDPWETEAGTFSFNEETKDVTFTPKKPLEYIEITFKV